MTNFTGKESGAKPRRRQPQLCARVPGNSDNVLPTADDKAAPILEPPKTKLVTLVSAKQKVVAVTCIEQGTTTPSAVAKQYGVSTSTVCRWLESETKAKIRAMADDPSLKNHSGRGLVPGKQREGRFPLMEADLRDWIVSQKRAPVLA
eukprot:jgi/Mesvir1/6482/Mv19555-RA.1